MFSTCLLPCSERVLVSIAMGTARPLVRGLWDLLLSQDVFFARDFESSCTEKLPENKSGPL